MSKHVQITAPNAPSGTVYFYAHGTNRPRVVYSDFDLTTAVGTSLTLDASGYASGYTNDLVDVAVFNVRGEQVQWFTVSDGDASTIVRSQSFTGTTPEGQQAGGGAVELRAALDLIIASFGAKNMLVRPGWSNVDLRLVDALDHVNQRITDLPPIYARTFFNVKDYGALGNGSHDDTEAIRDTFVAAEAAGGGIVFFPGGTYPMTEGIAATSRISVLGVNANASVVEFSMSTGTALELSGGDTAVEGGSLVRGVSLTSSAHADLGISVENIDGCVIEHCKVTGFKRCVASTSRIDIIGGTFEQDTDDDASEVMNAIRLGANAVGSVVMGAKVVGYRSQPPEGAGSDCNSPIYSEARGTRVAFCEIDLTRYLYGAGTGAVEIVSGDGSLIIGNTVVWTTACALPPSIVLKSGTGRIAELANFERESGGNSYHIVPMNTAADDNAQHIVGSREGMSVRNTWTARGGGAGDIAYADPRAKYNYMDIQGGYATTDQITVWLPEGALWSPNQEMVLIITNTADAARRVFFGSDFVGLGGTYVSIDAGKTIAVTCLSDKTTGRWYVINKMVGV